MKDFLVDFFKKYGATVADTERRVAVALPAGEEAPAAAKDLVRRFGRDKLSLVVVEVHREQVIEVDSAPLDVLVAEVRERTRARASLRARSSGSPGRDGRGCRIPRRAARGPRG